MVHVFGSVLRDLLGEPVDLVMVGAIKNPYILADIEQSKQLLYAAHRSMSFAGLTW